MGIEQYNPSVHLKSKPSTIGRILCGAQEDKLGHEYVDPS